MRTLKWIALAAISCLAACNITVGQCWIDENGNGEPDPGEPGAGGGPVVPPGGTGDNGDEPGKEPQDASNSPPCELIGSYDASLFKFAVVIADDGTGAAGGWQAATAKASFVDGRQDPPMGWSCNITVGMAIRSSTMGKISPEKAASLSADVLTAMASYTMHSREQWIASSFCNQLATNMEKYFAKFYTGAGAKVAGQ